MTSLISITEQAARLLEAEQSAVPVAPTPQEISFAQAYAIQNAGLDLKLQSGRSLRGYKIGLTSQALQRAMGAQEPIYGGLTDAMFFSTGETISIRRFIRPRLEVELAFVLGRPLSGPDCTLCDVLQAVDFVIPALEIVDSRLAQPGPPDRAGSAGPAGSGRKPALPDIISDNASSAGCVLGVSPFRPDRADLAWISAVCRRNGVIEDTGVAAAVLNHPAMGLISLARHLREHGGEGHRELKAGQVVLGGAFIPPVDIRPGDTFHVDYGPFGSVACHFSNDL